MDVQVREFDGDEGFYRKDSGWAAWSSYWGRKTQGETRNIYMLSSETDQMGRKIEASKAAVENVWFIS